MELQFIYFNKFKKIEQLELNFSFKFNFKIKENKLEYTIRDNYIENFWGSQIKEIIAIVGNNGTGKSTILELIKTLCATDPQNPIRKGDSLEKLEAVVILYDRILDNFFYFIEGPINIEIPKDILKLELLDNNSPINLPKTQFLYYSNSFEYKDEYIYDSLLDISTINCLDKSKYDLPEDDDSDEISWELIKSQFRFSEIYRQLKLISNTETKLPFETPKQIFISLVENETFFYPYDASLNEKDYSNSNYITISKFIERYDFNKIMKKENDVFSEFFLNLLKIALINYIKTKSNESSTGIHTANYKISPDEIAKYIESLKGENLKEDFVSFFDLFHKTNSFYFDGEELYNTLSDLSLFLNSEGEIKNNLLASITINDNNKLDFIYLIKRYINIKYYPDIIRFNWHDLSSGENAYLNIFSRIFDFSIINKNIETIILLLDEAELGFHPKWQKKFIHSLIDTLPRLLNTMNDGKNVDIQLILTSHSPFLLSDIPKESIIFLQYDEQKKTNVLSDLKNHEKTFGANIHTLLSDAFFMDEGLIGDFAKEKINDLFTYLIDESETDNKFNFDTAKQLIDLIGEPIVKLQLIQLFDKKFAKKSEIEWIEDQIEQLEKRKNELK